MTNNTKNTTQEAAVTVKNLKVYFPVRQGVFSKVTDHIRAVDDISFTIAKGDIFALVGESGCGKTTTAQAIAGLQTATSGEITLNLSNLPRLPFTWRGAPHAERKLVRQRLQFIFQDPYSSLNPRMTIYSILEEPLVIHGIGTAEERLKRIRELLDQVGLAEEYLNRYPHEFSGGQRQRIGIARALATNPEFIIADEPVSALDVSIQAQIINLLQDLRTIYNQTQLFISHDLAVVRHLANTVAVMYQGKIVEYGTESALFDKPRHPYTHLLLDSVPVPGKGRKKRRAEPDNDIEPSLPTGSGCSFYKRCPKRTDVCKDTIPQLTEYQKSCGHACFNPF